MKILKNKLLKCFALLTFSITLIQCDTLVLLSPVEINDKVKADFKYSIYNPDQNAHIVNSMNVTYEVPITSEYLFNSDYVWLATIQSVRHLYQFQLFYGEPVVYSASVSSILQYARHKIYEDRRLLPTLIYEDGTNWYMSVFPVFYEYRNEYAMNIDFNFNDKNYLLFTNIKPALKPIALSTKLADVVSSNFGPTFEKKLPENEVKSKLIDKIWYSMETNYKEQASNAPNYQFLANNMLKASTGTDDPSSISTNAVSKGWSIWQVGTINVNSYLNYVYLYDIKIMKIYLDLATLRDDEPFPSINSNLDVAMYWYNPANFSNASTSVFDAMFTRYTVDKN